MSSSRTSFSFGVVLLEWYEFTIYNLLIPYGIFGSTSTSSLYIGFAVLAMSFLARPLGSIFFSRISDRSDALRKSLQLMVVSTICMGLFPNQFSPIKAVWFAFFKLLQGFALGGSYGLSYIMVYENEEKKKRKNTNFKIALVQNGWVLGMLLGGITILMTKILVGNWQVLASVRNIQEIFRIMPSDAFYEYGWRIPFLFSGMLGAAMYAFSRKIKKQIVDVSDVNPFKYFLNKILTSPGKFLSIFLVMGIDMVISHIWFTYSSTISEAGNSEAYTTIMSNLRLLILLICLPIFARIADRIGQNGSYVILALVCISMIVSGFFAPWSSIFWIIISAIIAAMCYSVLITWVISQFDHEERQFMIGPMFSIAAATIGAIAPLLATTMTARFGESSPGYIIAGYGIFAFYGLYRIFSQEKGKIS